MAAKLEKLSKLEKAGKIHKLDPVTFFVDRRFNVTNFGPTAAKIEHRQILSHYVIASNEAERRIWSQLSNSMSSYGIEIEVYGATYNEQGLFVHHYNSKIRTVACFGGKPIYYGTKDAIANFDSIKADYGAPGYKESNTRLFINKIIVHPYEQIHQGGANPGKKSEGPEIVNLAPGIWARDTPLKIGYGDLKAGEDPMKNNNCAFRAIYSQVAKNRQKWFKQQFPLKTIRKEFGLPPNCKISPDELFMICDAKGVELTIIVVRGMDPETAEISIKSTQATGHVEPMIRVILHADTEHYYCPATGKSPDNHTTDYCGVCGEAVKLKDFLKHEYIHKIRHEFKSTLELPTGLLSRGDDESMKDYSKRHREFFVNIIIEFWNNPNYEEILAFLGPGGCGKSDVIKTFREMYKDLNIVCISKTGVASQNIRGQTYDSFMMKLRSKEPVLPDMIIIDEISFLSDMELNRLDFRLREIRNKASPMGGIKTIFMGDFLQLLPFKNKSCVFTELFQNHVRAVPMMYPFRYKDDNYFFKLLLKIRSGGLHLSDFMKADFGMMTRSEWVTGFRPENRPTLLVQINEDRRMLEADARAYDLRTYEDLETYKIHLQVDRVEADPSGVPLDKEQARLVGSSKGHVYSDVEHPGHKATFCIALNSKEFDGEINSDKDTFYTRERLMTLMNKCDDKGLLMNGSEVFFHSIQNVGGEEFMVVETMDGELCSIPKYKRGCNLKGTFYICEGFPVQSAMVTTVFKAQGKTYPAVVVDVPRCNMNKNTQHLYYVTNAEKIAKLGRYCDEVANDYKCGHMVNYRQGVYTKVVLFGAGGPKAYGALLQAPDGQIIPKNRIKGIKEDAFTFYVTDDGSDKRTIDGDNIKFSKKAEAITRLIHKAVRTPGAYISTFYRQSFKSYGFIPQGHERVTNDAGQIKRAEPWTQCITNVRRDVLKEVASRRRLLTSEEVKYLGLNEYDASRILVPNGWNWDGALFRLI